MQTNNQLLLNLPEGLRQELLDASELTLMDLYEKMYNADEDIEYLNFPEVGVISVVRKPEGGDEIEVVTVGSEGAVGMTIIYGIKQVKDRAYCQVEGKTRRIKASIFLQLYENNKELQNVCNRYMAVLYDQITGNLSCNQNHSIEERSAKWLLSTQDRAHADHFMLTQEFLAIMLGVSRTGVNAAAGRLAQANLIKFVRGKVTILDRDGLKKISCACYTQQSDYFKYAMRTSLNE